MLSVAMDTLWVRTVERHANEELGGHAAALTRVEASAAGAGAGRLRLPELGEQRGGPPHLREPAALAHRARLELIVQHERACVDVTDRVDEAHHPAGTAEVQPGQRLTQRGQMEERIAGEHRRAAEQPVVQLAL